MAVKKNWHTFSLCLHVGEPRKEVAKAFTDHIHSSDGFGLVNAANRYLTAEPFRFQVSATGRQLKPRQVWILQFVTPHGAGAAGPGEWASQRLHLIGALKRYLAADCNGKVTCDQDKPGPQTVFLLQQFLDGKVSFQNELTKRYLGGAEENVTCFAQCATETEKWTLHLAVHPNVAMFCPNRKRYVRCDEKVGLMRCDRDMPWGAESVITLYYDFVGKKYGLRNGGGKLLSSNGALVSDVSAQTLYSLEVNNGLVAFRDEEGRYLTGREGGMRTIKMDKPGRDELFSMEPSPAQVSMRSLSTSKFICCRPGHNPKMPLGQRKSLVLVQDCHESAIKHFFATLDVQIWAPMTGADLYANAMAVGNTEIFQLLVDDNTKKVCFRGYCGTYLSLGPNDCIISSAKQEKNVWFDLHYQDQKVSLLIGDKHLTMRPNGQLLAVPKAAGKSEDFLLVLVNRPLLVLHSEAGYVGLGTDTRHLEGNCVTYVVSSLSLTEEGYYNFLIGGSYWCVDKEGHIVLSDHPSNFTIQFVSSNGLIIKASNNKFLAADQGGRLWTGASVPSNATVFHY